MSLTSPLSCISNDSYFYSAFCFYILCRWKNQICSTTSLMNLGMTPGPMVRTISRFFFACWRVLCWFFGFWSFHTNRSQVYCWCFCVWRFCTATSRVQRWFTPWNILALKLIPCRHGQSWSCSCQTYNVWVISWFCSIWHIRIIWINNLVWDKLMYHVYESKWVIFGLTFPVNSSRLTRVVGGFFISYLTRNLTSCR